MIIQRSVDNPIPRLILFLESLLPWRHEPFELQPPWFEEVSTCSSNLPISNVSFRQIPKLKDTKLRTMQNRWIAACRVHTESRARNLAALLGCTRLWDECSITASCSAVPDPTSKWRRQDERAIEEDEQGACDHLNKKKAALRKGLQNLASEIGWYIEDLWYLSTLSL